MDEEALYVALGRVRDHFKAREVTVASVLAAYLRRDGLPTKGDVWDMASAAVRAGYTFEEAAAAGQRAAGRPSNRAASTSLPRPQGQVVEPSAGVALGRSGIRPAAVKIENRSPDVGTSTDTSSPAGGSRAADLPKVSFDEAAGVPRLRWFGKRTGPGDIDGAGLKKLLGKPAHNNLEVLVRETAQNSWDARTEGKTPEYQVHLRSLKGDSLESLRASFNLVHAPSAADTGIYASLSKNSIPVIEIFDRGTIGLGGPTRNDLLVRDGVAKNYINLVLNVGVRNSSAGGGGTYGFGKISTFKASACRTVILWTQCLVDGEPEHRLIAASLGDGFSVDGQSYTGHQWWGNPTDDRVEPLIGDSARLLGERLFSRSFGDELGTSILIIDSNVAGTEDSVSAEVSRAIAQNLWPKMLPIDGVAPMNISLLVNGEEVPLPGGVCGALSRAYKDCLEAVRGEQSGSISNGRTDVVVTEIVNKSTKQVLGHLALTDVDHSEGGANGTELHPPSRVCLMRNEAELVVKYEQFPNVLGGMTWCGVFKPTRTFDGAFAAAEPPAHDDWIARSVEDSGQRSIVNVAATRRREAVAAFLAPAPGIALTDSGSRQSSGELADELGWLVPAVAPVKGGSTGGVKGSKPGNRPKRRAVRPKATVELVRRVTLGGIVKAEIVIGLQSTDGSRARVKPRFQTLTEDGRDPASVEEVGLGWSGFDGCGLSDEGSVEMSVGSSATATLRYPADRVVSIEVGVEEMTT